GELKLGRREAGSWGECRLGRVDVLWSQVAATDVVPAGVDHGSRGGRSRLLEYPDCFFKPTKPLQGVGPCIQDLEPSGIHLGRSAKARFGLGKVAIRQTGFSQFEPPVDRRAGTPAKALEIAGGRRVNSPDVDLRRGRTTQPPGDGAGGRRQLDADDKW